MNRREALTATAALFGGTIIGSQIFLTGCGVPKKREAVFGAEDLTLLDEVSETIIPTTAKAPGAKAAKIGEFMKTIVTDCYDESEQKIFFDGLTKLNEFSAQKSNSDFLKLSEKERTMVLAALDKEADEYKTKKSEKDPEHYFTMIKQLTIWGYFSSEPGATMALRYVPIPGRYEGCIDYKVGEGAWVY